MYFAFTSLVTLAAASLALAQPAPLSINPDPSMIKSPVSARAIPAEPLTNAKRLAMNLPREPHGRGHHIGTHVRGVPRDDSKSRHRTTCNILAKYTNGTRVGYITAKLNEFGEYGLFQPKRDGALVVSFSPSCDGDGHDQLTHQLNLLATNSPWPGFPYFGAIVGFVSTNNSLGPNSYNYAYLGGTMKFPAGSLPVLEYNSFSNTTGIPKDTESAIWSYDPKAHAITAQWVNTDHSTPPNHIVYANDFNNALVLTGDVPLFQSTFGVPYPEVTFKCVSPDEKDDSSE